MMTCVFKGPFESCMDMFEKGWHFYGDYFQHLIRKALKITNLNIRDGSGLTNTKVS